MELRCRSRALWEHLSTKESRWRWPFRGPKPERHWERTYWWWLRIPYWKFLGTETEKGGRSWLWGEKEMKVSGDQEIRCLIGAAHSWTFLARSSILPCGVREKIGGLVRELNRKRCRFSHTYIDSPKKMKKRTTFNPKMRLDMIPKPLNWYGSWWSRILVIPVPILERWKSGTSHWVGSGEYM